MPKNKKPFLIRDHYWHDYYEAQIFWHANYATPVLHYPIYERGRRLHGRENTTTHEPPALSTREDLIQQLTLYIEAGDIDNLGKYLQEDYIIERVEDEYQHYDHGNYPYESQGHNKTFANFHVRPRIEQLVLDRDAFTKLLALAEQKDGTRSIKIKPTFLQALQYVQMDVEERPDFSSLDLTGARFDGATLGQANFSNAITKGVHFYGCSMQHSNITQEQLEVSFNYGMAKLPVGLWGFWDDTLKQQLSQCLTDMYNYAIKYIPKTDPKFQEIITLCTQPQLTQAGNPSYLYKATLLKNLQHAKATTLSQHRDLYFLIKECLAIVAGVGIGYCIVASINYRKTGYFGIFTQPKTHQKSQAIEQLLLTTYRTR